jgi:hypothetical protein
VKRRPRLRSAAHDRTEHELEDRLLAEAVGNDLPAPLLDEQALEQIRGANDAAMGERQS